MPRRQLFWYARDVESFERDTQGLNLTEVGAYNRLLDAYYRTGGNLQANACDLLRVCRAISPEEQQAVERVVSAYFTVEDGMLRQKRADEELEKARKIRGMRQDSGKKGGLARMANAQANATANAQANAQASGEAKSNTTTYTRSTTPDTSLRSVSAADAAKLTKDEVWSIGRAMLAKQGAGPKTAGSYLGHLIKNHGEGQVLDALRAAAVEQPAELKGWLIGRLKPKPETRTATRAAIGRALEGGRDDGPRDITAEGTRLPSEGDGCAVPQAGQLLRGAVA
jgi:uncharacterized protein YdaU (DUF1376 family)